LGHYAGAAEAGAPRDDLDTIERAEEIGKVAQCLANGADRAPEEHREAGLAASNPGQVAQGPRLGHRRPSAH
jgi:hypothetical protein